MDMGGLFFPQVLRESVCSLYFWIWPYMGNIFWSTSGFNKKNWSDSPIHTFALLYSDSGESTQISASANCLRRWSSGFYLTERLNRSWSVDWFLFTAVTTHGLHMNCNSDGPCWKGQIMIHVWPAWSWLCTVYIFADFLMICWQH